ncbi:MAG: hypothetical protein LBD46_08540 [Endomicrobium sp.]|jgi:hypothetical protein|nr:hypothetical protein [Endomicrobium sp.]
MKIQEIKEVSKDYEYGFADGIIVSAEHAVELLQAHSNIKYVAFSNDERCENYESLSEAADDGIELDRSEKYYL